jgi:predicted transcriptional regulator
LDEEPQEVSLNFTELAAEIVSAYVSNNPVPASELPALIAQVHSAFSGLTSADGPGAATTDAQTEKPTPG